MITGKKDYDFYPKELAEKYRADDERIIKSGKVETIEEDYITCDEQHLVVQTVKTPIWDEQGAITGLLGIFMDITERKQVEEAIKKSLTEKEVLLREIHHRVKNNMQVIISMLRLQSEKTEGKRESGILKESQDRIKAMALIHEKLYQSRNLAEIDFPAYVKRLVNGIVRSYNIDINKITTKIEIENILLGLDRAIPCGLIINELVSNSLKYAFPESRKGEIGIALRSVNADEVELMVNDNGAGIPEALDFKNTDSLGLDLVTILAEDQLEGKIELSRDSGTCFHIRFRKKTDKERA